LSKPYAPCGAKEELLIIIIIIIIIPIVVTRLCKAPTAFSYSNDEIAASNPARGMDVCPSSSSAMDYAGIGLAMG
jgi:hypothetical protein